MSWRTVVRALALVLAVGAALIARPVWALCTPSVRGIFPASGIVGTTVTAGVPGTGLAGATASVFGAPGLVVTVQSAGDTAVSLQLQIDPAAVPGERIISLTTPGGVVAVDFTVNAVGGPVVDAVAPTPLAVQGSPLSLSITGQGLAALTVNDVTVSGTGVTVTAATAAPDGTSLDVSLDTAADAEPGTRALVIASPTGGAVLQLRVQRPPPVIASVSPGAGEVGATVPLTITGSHLTGAALVITSGSGGQGGVTVSQIATPDDSTLTASLAISSSLSSESEARLLIVTTESGQVTAEFFVVAAGAPSVTAIRPGAGEPGETVGVTLRGLNLTGAVTSTSSGSLSLQNVVVIDDETLELDVVVAPSATANTNHTLTVTVGTATASATFRVIAANAPFIGAVSPPFGNRGTTMRLTLDGVNLSTVVPGSGIELAGPKITESNAAAVDDLTAQAVLDIDLTASVGARDVTVTTAMGSTTKSAAFRVNVPGQVPVISDVSPGTVEPGTTTAITVTGSNLADAGVTVGGSGATVTNVVAQADGTTVTFDLTLAADAAAEHRSLVVVTESGTATCSIESGADVDLRAAGLVRAGSVFEVTTPGFRLFLFEFSMNERFDAGLRTFAVLAGDPTLTLSRLQTEAIGRAVRDLPFGYVRARAVTATNQIGISDPVRFRR